MLLGNQRPRGGRIAQNDAISVRGHRNLEVLLHHLGRFPEEAVHEVGIHDRVHHHGLHSAHLPRKCERGHHGLDKELLFPQLLSQDAGGLHRCFEPVVLLRFGDNDLIQVFRPIDDVAPSRNGAEVGDPHLASQGLHRRKPVPHALQQVELAGLNNGHLGLGGHHGMFDGIANLHLLDAKGPVTLERRANGYSVDLFLVDCCYYPFL